MKTLKNTSKSPAGVQVTDSSITATVGTKAGANGLFVDDTGTYLSGNLSIVTQLDNVRISGLWMENSQWMQMFPSTMAFPIPRLRLDPPLAGLAEMAQAVSWFMSLLV